MTTAPARWHELKTDPEVFDAVAAGRKTCEIRRNDRDFKVGDGLLLRRTRYTGAQMHMRPEACPLEYTGEVERRIVSHVLSGYGLGDGWVILSFASERAAGDQRPNEHASVSAPAYCEIHQHYKWCEHNGGVMGPTGYAAPAAAPLPVPYSSRVQCASCDGSGSTGEYGCTDCLGKGLDPAAFCGGIEGALNDAYAEGRKDEREAILAAAPLPQDEPQHCGSYGCKAAKRDGVLCADGECDIAAGVRAPLPQDERELTNLYSITGDIKDINTLLINRAEYRAALSAASPAAAPAAAVQPVGQLLEEQFGRGQVMWFRKPADGTLLYAAAVQSDADAARLLANARVLCRWIAESPHQRGSINGMAAQLAYAIDAALGTAGKEQS